MFGVGLGELLVIFLVVLLVFGPDKLPEVAKTLAKLVREFRQAQNDLHSSLIRTNDIIPKASDMKGQLLDRILKGVEVEEDTTTVQRQKEAPPHG